MYILSQEWYIYSNSPLYIYVDKVHATNLYFHLESTNWFEYVSLKMIISIMSMKHHDPLWHSLKKLDLITCISDKVYMLHYHWLSLESGHNSYSWPLITPFPHSSGLSHIHSMYVNTDIKLCHIWAKWPQVTDINMTYDPWHMTSLNSFTCLDLSPLQRN